MKNLVTYSFLFLLLNVNNLIAQQYSWKQRTNFGGVVRASAFGFSIDSLGYAGGGDAGVKYNDFWQYHPTTNSWTQISSIPIALTAASSFVINHKGYVTGGAANAGYNNTLYMYDPIANIWTTKATYPGVAIYGAAGFAIGNKGYFGVGNAGSATGPYYRDFYEYDPGTDGWTQKASFPGIARFAVYGISLNGMGYLGFGLDANTTTSFNDWWQYDPVTDTWTEKTSYPDLGRSYPSGFVINNKIYIGIGDYHSVNTFNDFFEYDAATDVWTQKPNYGGGYRSLGFSFSIGNIGYFGTGFDLTNRYNDFWEYAPDSISPPVATFQSSDSIICANSCINFTDLSTNAISWLWSFPGGTPSSSTDQNPQSVCYFVSGHYNVTLIASNSSGADTLQLTNYITVNPVPATPVITESHDTLYCKTDSSYTSYQWYYYTNAIPGATDTFLISYYSGNYNVGVTNKYGCSIAVGITIILGLNEAEANPYFNIYPNPVGKNLNISMLKTFQNADVEIFDILGRKLYDQAFNSGKDSNFTIDLGEFAPGTYFIVATIDGFKVTRKIIKTGL